MKVCLKGTRLKVDITIGHDGGVQAIAFVKEELKQLPLLKCLIRLLKHYLKRKGLNEVYTGGLSSFSLTMMFVGFVKLLDCGEISLPGK